MASGTELEILKIVKDEGGEATAQVVSHRMGSGLGLDYIRLVCNSLGRADYIDVSAAGRLRLTGKGEGAIAVK